jgi:hypothetical protein
MDDAHGETIFADVGDISFLQHFAQDTISVRARRYGEIRRKAEVITTVRLHCAGREYRASSGYV